MVQAPRAGRNLSLPLRGRIHAGIIGTLSFHRCKVWFALFARVTVWEPTPDDDRQWVIDAAKAVPGVLNAYHLIDPETGMDCRSRSSRTTSIPPPATVLPRSGVIRPSADRRHPAPRPNCVVAQILGFQLPS